MKVFDPATNTITFTPDVIELLEVCTEHMEYNSVQQTATVLLIHALQLHLTPEVVAEITQRRTQDLVDTLTQPRFIPR